MNRPPEVNEAELLRRAEMARQVTTNEMYREAWASLVSNLQNAWETTKPMQTEEREALWHAMKAVKGVQQRLESLMATGREVERRQNQRKATRVGTRPIR